MPPGSDPVRALHEALTHFFAAAIAAHGLSVLFEPGTLFCMDDAGMRLVLPGAPRPAGGFQCYTCALVALDPLEEAFRGFAASGLPAEEIRDLGRAFWAENRGMATSQLASEVLVLLVEHLAAQPEADP